MTKDEIQFWILIAFAVVFVLSSYKIHLMFSAKVEGIDTKTQHNQLEDIIIDFLKQLQDSDLNSDNLFELISELEILQDETYKNFNRNRFNQLLQQLFYTYEVDNVTELILRMHQPERDTSKENAQ